MKPIPTFTDTLFQNARLQGRISVRPAFRFPNAFKGYSLSVIRHPLSVTTLSFLLLGTLIVWLRSPHTFPITTVRVTGQHHTSPQSLATILNSLATGGFFTVDRPALRVALLTAFPILKEVQINRVWPDTLQISLQEYQPIAYWNPTRSPKQVLGTTDPRSPKQVLDSLVDAQGLLFTVPGPPSQELSALPTFSGPKNCLQALVNRFRELNSYLTPVGLKIEELQCHATHAWTVILNNHLTLLLGRDNIEQRIQRFTQTLSFLKKLSFYPNLTIDLRYTNGFAVQPQKSMQKLSFLKKPSFSGSQEVIYAS